MNEIKSATGGVNAALPNSQNISNTEADRMKQKLDSFLEEYENSVDFSNELRQVIKKVRRCRKEFDATRFFVLVVGPVKSGKSTLVNIFARKYVSPTAYLECTALPTIIGKTASGDNKIVQYLPTEKYRTEEAQIETFNIIIDLLRGVEEDKSILAERIKTKISELEKEKVKEIVTFYHNEDNRDKEELLITIGTEGCGFIDDEIMLIDMPGLDGERANEQDNFLYKAMAQRADVIFFVQSTTSAINRESIDFLKNLYEGKDGKVPVWLIHNIHDSQYFLADNTKIDDEIEKQIQTGRERIEKGFGINRFDHIRINLGKVNAVIYEEQITPANEETVRKEFEAYQSIEKNLIDKLKTERREIKEENNVGKTKDTIKKSVETVEKVITETKNKKQTVIDNIGKLNNLSAKFNRVQVFDTPFLTEYDNLLSKENIKSSWETQIASIIQNKLPNNGDNVKGVDLKAKIDRITVECSNAIPTGMGTQFRNQLETSLKNIISEPLTSVVSEIEQTINEILQSEPISLTKYIDTKLLNNKPSNFTPEYFNIIEKKRHIYTFGYKKVEKYNRTEHREILTDLRNIHISDIPAKLQEYRNILKTNFTVIRDNCIENLKSQINDYAKQYENEQKPVIEKLTQEIDLMKKMLADLKY
jgi:GTPase Era involved in 16S rRNA processing